MLRSPWQVMQVGRFGVALGAGGGVFGPGVLRGLLGVAVLALHAQTMASCVAAVLAPVVDVALRAVGGLAGAGIDEHDLAVGQGLLGMTFVAVALVAGAGQGFAFDAAVGARHLRVVAGVAGGAGHQLGIDAVLNMQRLDVAAVALRAEIVHALDRGRRGGIRRAEDVVVAVAGKAVGGERIAFEHTLMVAGC